MFTGIIRAIGEIADTQTIGGDRRITVDTAALRDHDFTHGDSVSVNGVCLTVVGIDGSRLAFDVSLESLSLTSLAAAATGTRVNLEPAATPSTALGGHIVSGHVDTTATVTARRPDARSVRFEFEVPAPYARYLAPKGSVCVDGTSLTVNGVTGATFDVNIVPHTLEHTIMGTYQVGTVVNIEVDVIARYVERLLSAGVLPSTGQS